MDMDDSSGRVAIVTGAGSGIGRAAALALLGAGYRVVLAGRRREPLEQVAEQAQGSALVVPTDVTREADVQRLFADSAGHFGRVDVLFNNAGAFGATGLLEDIALDEWQAMVDVNLTGMFLCLREAFRTMKAQDPQGGRIINNGSISATTPRPNSIAYTATKHAVTGLTKSAALDGRKYHIAVGQIDVGNAATEMTGRMSAGIEQASGQRMVEPTMDVNIVGESVRYMASLPLQANVLFHTVMATTMPFVGRG
ncbi:MAG: SDR family oxidoreductase [Ottowia sp.]|nr:SDR family oxidoreductase [Ottowia sp.]